MPKGQEISFEGFSNGNSIFFRYDPVGVKKIVALDVGFSYECIEDEYYSEATEIALKIDSWDSVENLTAIVKTIMDYSFDEDFSVEYCTLIAREIWNGRRQQMKRPKEFYMEDIMLTKESINYKIIQVD